MPNLTQCGADGCEKLVGPKSARGMCSKHYQRWLKSRAPGCSFTDCTSPVVAHGLCSGHYRQSRSGAALKPKRPAPGSLTVEQRFWTHVDKGGDCWVWSSALDMYGYGRMLVSGEVKRAHRLSWEFENGPIPAGKVIDHICHTPACVRPSHLRPADQKHNSEYRAGASRANKSTGVRGVYPGKQDGTWYAVLTHEYKQLHLGTFRSVEEADAVVRAKRAELFTFPEVA